MLPSSYLPVSKFPRTSKCSVPTLAVSSPLRLDALLSFRGRPMVVSTLAGVCLAATSRKGVVLDSEEKRDELVCARTEVTQKRAVGAPPLRRAAAVLCCSRLGWSSYR